MRHSEKLSAFIRRFGQRPVRAGRHPALAGTATLAAWAYTGLVVLWLGFWIATGEALLPVRLTIAFVYWIALGLTVVAALALWQRRWRLAALSVPLALLLGVPYLPQYLPRFGAPPATGETFTVMSYNVMGRNRDVDAIAAVILTERPDILFLQEFHLMDALRGRIGSLYGGDPVHEALEPHLGLAVLSRFPLAPLPPLRRIQKAVAHLPCGDIHLWNLRAPKTFDGPAAQHRFVIMLAEDMRTEEGPAMAAGDFNLTERSAPYSYLRGFLRNAHEDAGFGLGATFPAPGRNLGRILPAMIRIDHMFYSSGLTPLHAEVLSEAGKSDHYPLKAQFIC
ncbi:endonuclease/exonuclease/phosphatase family protein [Parvibaculum sp.]|uniref:endonuclease/exonuclease/phosphatase family protein n=1 Tax=Parvibaculum sp. TaxID=2024848 RepID=UPI001D39D80F|nr:endonuclease/exonuclease/phosphatase family protein [Parvibaculum sp.]MBX3489218.1 endonuclease/exonuclease/phosphatase family protein [Parvibaculum sp.]